jgi:hypothetical protein
VPATSGGSTPLLDIPVNRAAKNCKNRTELERTGRGTTQRLLAGKLEASLSEQAAFKPRCRRRNSSPRLPLLKSSAMQPYLFPENQVKQDRLSLQAITRQRSAAARKAVGYQSFRNASRRRKPGSLP